MPEKSDKPNLHLKASHVVPHRSPIWYNLHSYIIYQRGQFEKGLYFPHKYLFLVIHVKGFFKAKGPHHHQFQKCSLSNLY
jgi:hypothetical protein